MASYDVQREQLEAARAAFRRVVTSAPPRFRVGLVVMLALTIAMVFAITTWRSGASAIKIDAMLMLLILGVGGASPFVVLKFHPVVDSLRDPALAPLRMRIERQIKGLRAEHKPTETATILTVFVVLMCLVTLIGAVTAAVVIWLLGMFAVVGLMQQLVAKTINNAAVIGAWLDGRECYSCSYDLTGNSSGTCPECGTAMIGGMREEPIDAGAQGNRGGSD